MTQKLPTYVVTDDLPVFFVDESGSRLRKEQGNYFVFGGVLTSNVDELRKTVRSTLNRHYPGCKTELKAKNIKPQARSEFFSKLSNIPDLRVYSHVVIKNKVLKNDLLEDQHRFYKSFYANLMKIVLGDHPSKVHIVTDQHYNDLREFEHFKNCIKIVNPGRIASITPVSSMTEYGVQAADVVAGTIRYKMLDHHRAEHYDHLHPLIHLDADTTFPRGNISRLKI